MDHSASSVTHLHRPSPDSSFRSTVTSAQSSWHSVRAYTGTAGHASIFRTLTSAQSSWHSSSRLPLCPINTPHSPAFIPRYCTRSHRPWGAEAHGPLALVATGYPVVPRAHSSLFPPARSPMLPRVLTRTNRLWATVTHLHAGCLPNGESLPIPVSLWYCHTATPSAAPRTDTHPRTASSRPRTPAQVRPATPCPPRRSHAQSFRRTLLHNLNPIPTLSGGSLTLPALWPPPLLAPLARTDRVPHPLPPPGLPQALGHQ